MLEWVLLRQLHTLPQKKRNFNFRIFGPNLTGLHSSAKERQLQKSCVSFWEECMGSKWSYGKRIVSKEQEEEEEEESLTECYSIRYRLSVYPESNPAENNHHRTGNIYINQEISHVSLQCKPRFKVGEGTWNKTQSYLLAISNVTQLDIFLDFYIINLPSIIVW